MSGRGPSAHNKLEIDPSSDQVALIPVLLDVEQLGCLAWLVDQDDVVIWTNDPAGSAPCPTCVIIPVADSTKKMLHVADAQRIEDEMLWKLSLAESEHRSRNLVSLAIAIANQSLGSLLSEASVVAFINRLHSLTEVAKVGPRQTGQGCEMHVLVGAVTARFDDPRQRIKYHGPNITMPARWTHMLGMVLHELSANALRHGSLSSDQGAVDIEWQVSDQNENDEQQFELKWTETGGPEPIPAADRTKGYGSRIIHDMIASSPRCTVSLDLPAEGLKYRLMISMKSADIRF